MQSPDSAVIIGHRGAAGLASENSLEAIQLAIAQGVELVEIDLHQSRDGRLIVMHNTTVNATTNGKGRIGRLDHDDIAGLTLQPGPSANPAPQHVPVFEEVLKLVKTAGIRLMIEVKKPGRYPGIGNRMVRAIRHLGMSDQVEVFSFDHRFIRQLQQNHPEIAVGTLVVFPHWVKKAGAVNRIGVSHRFLANPKHLKRLRNKGYRTIYAWTVNDPQEAKALLKNGVDGIITDYPDRVRKE